MTPEPKRRGRPPKVRDDPALDRLVAISIGSATDAIPTMRLRLKPGVGIQQAWTHHNGTEWRALPVVAASAPDWEDA